MNSQISTLTIVFDNVIPFNRISSFRGAVLSKVSREMDIFHNHSENNLKYRYPLIQYKSINNKAAIVCIKEGVDAIGAFFSNSDINLRIGERTEQYSINNITADKTEVGLTDGMRIYTIRKWLALNGENYNQFAENVTVEERTDKLEKILIGNMLSCCKGLDIVVEGEIKCEIQQVLKVDLYEYKNMKMTGFDVVFSTNMMFPDFIGLGKGVSRGFGVLKQNM